MSRHRRDARDEAARADHERVNRVFWDADADDYQALHGTTIGRTPRAWGVWRIPDTEVDALGDVTGCDVLEYGCGAAQWSRALAADGARVVALDQSREQLRHAAPAAAAGVRLVCAGGEHLPFADAAFDVVFADHGAMSFCDPDRSLPEVARVLRPGGRFAFSHTTPWPYLAWDEQRERVGRRLERPYFGFRRFDSGEGTVDFSLGYGDWIRRFRAHGFLVEDLVELRAPKRARTTFPDFDARWARRWPAEQVWKLRRT
jgi:SAM-dependent methyltransferase